MKSEVLTKQAHLKEDHGWSNRIQNQWKVSLSYLTSSYMRCKQQGLYCKKHQSVMATTTRLAWGWKEIGQFCILCCELFLTFSACVCSLLKLRMWRFLISICRSLDLQGTVVLLPPISHSCRQPKQQHLPWITFGRNFLQIHKSSLKETWQQTVQPKAHTAPTRDSLGFIKWSFVTWIWVTVPLPVVKRNVGWN